MYHYKIILTDNSKAIFTFVLVQKTNSTYQKYFYDPNLNDPQLLFIKDNEVMKAIYLEPTKFKSGKNGFSGMDVFENLLIRSNISESGKQNYKRLTIVIEQMQYSSEIQNTNYFQGLTI